MNHQPHSREPKLLDRVRAKLRVRHYSIRTEDAYIGWIRRYIHFHEIRHPDDMGSVEVVEFLSDLAVNGGVAASTQNQALSALVFLYREVLGRELEGLDSAVRARAPQRLPVAMTQREVRAVLEHLSGDDHLVATILYGCGLRLLECLRLRVKDIDFGRRQIIVRRGKGDRDRATVLPRSVEGSLQRRLEEARVFYDADRRAERPGVALPYALARKYPTAAYEWTWFWVFPSDSLSKDPRSGLIRRHHFHESRIQLNVRSAALAAKI